MLLPVKCEKRFTEWLVSVQSSGSDSSAFCIVTPPLVSGLVHEVSRSADTAVPIANKILINGSFGL